MPRTILQYLIHITLYTHDIFHNKRLKLDLRLLLISLHFCLLFLLSCCQIPKANENWPQGVDNWYPDLEAQWHKHCYVTISATVQTGVGRIVSSHSKISAWLRPKFINFLLISHTSQTSWFMMVSYQRTEAVAVTLLCLGWQIWNILNLHHFEVGIIWHHVDPLSPSVFLPSFDLCFQKGHFGFLCLQFLNFINTMPAVKPFPPTEKTKNNIEKKKHMKIRWNHLTSSNIQPFTCI